MAGAELIGFACYDATAKGFFGPTGVAEPHRGQGVGGQLLTVAMDAMRAAGYGYAIFGWVAPKAIPLYQRQVGAMLIPNSEPVNSIYRNLISVQVRSNRYAPRDSNPEPTD